MGNDKIVGFMFCKKVANRININCKLEVYKGYDENCCVDNIKTPVSCFVLLLDCFYKTMFHVKTPDKIARHAVACQAVVLIII